MKKIILLLIIGIILVSGCTQQGNKSQENTAAESESGRDFLQENTYIYASLKSVGIEPLVDTTQESVLVRFEASEIYSTQASVIASLSAAAVVTKSDNIIVQVYNGSKKMEEVKTTRQAVLDTVNEKSSIETFIDSLYWQRF